MHPKGSCKCQHCGELFVPDARNRGRQRVCAKVPCRKARQAQSRRAWLQQPVNADYFRGPENVARVQAWRQAHPGYWRGSPRRSRTLQDALNEQPAVEQQVVTPDESGTLQDDLAAQSPVIVGLIAHLVGSTLQDDIALMTRRLHSRGRAVLGTDVPRSVYAKTSHCSGSGAARAAPV